MMLADGTLAIPAEKLATILGLLKGTYIVPSEAGWLRFIDEERKTLGWIDLADDTFTLEKPPN
jgi:hypothetical protein